MTGAFARAGAVDLVEINGAFEDGWCEPRLKVTFRARREIEACSALLWLKPEPHRTEAHIRIFVNDEESLTLAVPYDMPSVAAFSCPARADEIVAVRIECSNEVMSKGADLRALSFQLRSIHFS